jgi:hypothetical protein
MRDFKKFIQRLIVGANSVYFRDVIEAASGYQIKEIDEGLLSDLEQLKTTFQTDLKKINSTVKITYKGRANELSNYMERVVLDEINSIRNFAASKPTVSGKRHQSAGYPDLVVTARGRPFYLEVKTFQLKTAESSLRTFYYKPSKNSKISESCPHLLIAFEVESLGQENKSPFVVNKVKIIDLYDLKVSLKPEFNASNIEIYKCTQI